MSAPKRHVFMSLLFILKYNQSLKKTNSHRNIFIGVINLGRVAQSLVVANHCLTTGQPDVTKADHYYKGGIV